MQRLKKLWTRFLRYLDAERERRRILAEMPSDKRVKEMIAAVKAGQAKIDAAAVKAGIL